MSRYSWDNLNSQAVRLLPTTALVELAAQITADECNATGAWIELWQTIEDSWTGYDNVSATIPSEIMGAIDGSTMVVNNTILSAQRYNNNIIRFIDGTTQSIVGYVEGNPEEQKVNIYFQHDNLFAFINSGANAARRKVENYVDALYNGAEVTEVMAQLTQAAQATNPDLTAIIQRFSDSSSSAVQTILDTFTSSPSSLNPRSLILSAFDAYSVSIKSIQDEATESDSPDSYLWDNVESYSFFEGVWKVVTDILVPLTTSLILPIISTAFGWIGKGVCLIVGAGINLLSHVGNNYASIDYDVDDTLYGHYFAAPTHTAVSSDYTADFMPFYDSIFGVIGNVGSTTVRHLNESGGSSTIVFCPRRANYRSGGWGHPFMGLRGLAAQTPFSLDEIASDVTYLNGTYSYSPLPSRVTTSASELNDYINNCYMQTMADMYSLIAAYAYETYGTPESTVRYNLNVYGGTPLISWMNQHATSGSTSIADADLMDLIDSFGKWLLSPWLTDSSFSASPMKCLIGALDHITHSVCYVSDDQLSYPLKPQVVPTGVSTASFIVGVIALATVATSAAVLTYKAVRKIKTLARRWQYRKQGRVDIARQAYLTNPTMENKDAYFKALAKSSNSGSWVLARLSGRATYQDTLNYTDTPDYATYLREIYRAITGAVV